ncbi:hypothetical protein PHLH6_32660 [Pseudomonas sp. Seg1]|uniref:YceK/YidQ family lipoprotein n=1 Tax=Pseudomonas sp. Seg1 TaxID=2678259 RepID=UPI001BB37DA3|nr:hypothetical protein PHLH6_32660 [Pseudomonas sp. Seg1]
MLIFAASQIGGCAFLIADSYGGYSCFEGTKVEFTSLMPLVGPLIILDLPFTLIADTIAFPTCL